MRILHTADLHIGKVVNGFSMLDEQAHSLKQIINYLKEYHVDTLIIAGDIYDKKMPSDSSVELFDKFLLEVAKLNITCLIISGNHDSGIKLQFANSLLKKQDIFIIGKYDGKLSKITLKDQYGDINFYLLPFIKPSDIRQFDSNISTYNEAVAYSLNNEEINYDKRNVFIGHQFYASGTEEISESEIISVGGSESVAYNHLLDFDYSALGHLHKPQRLMSDYIRYSGSITPYSESEITSSKSVVLLDLKEKGEKSFELLRLNPLLNFRKVKDYLDNILSLEASDDYMFITLLDENVIDAMGKLRSKFKNIMTLDFDNKRTKEDLIIDNDKDLEDIATIDLFAKFFKLQNNQDLSDKQRAIIESIVERIDENASN